MPLSLSEELQWRGFMNQTTYKDLTVLDAEPITFYWGVDPSADSMTVGNLASAMMVKAFIKHGHRPVLLIGGATGMIGDPDGKSEERPLKSLEEIDHNKTAITEQYRRIFGEHTFEPVDNHDWFKDMGYLDFLREVGKHVPMRQMLARDFVQTRLGENGSGISYAEFSYVLIQAYDFLYLYKNHDVSLQVCGSDQWGNSVAGVDLIRRMTGGEANVYSVPLIVNTSTGKKFGKSEDGAVWLDASKTSVYKFYQFWLNVGDDDVGDYIKVFTELDKDAVAQLMTKFEQDRSTRVAQKQLAHEVTRLIHGVDQAEKQQRIAEAITSQNVSDLNETELATIRDEMPTMVTGDEADVVEVLTKTGLAGSNSEARQLLNTGAVYINGQSTNRQHFEPSDFKNNRLLLRRGKAFKDSALIETDA